MVAEMKGASGSYDGATKEEIERRKKEIKNTLCCPYCGDRLKKLDVPQTIFTQWSNDYFYVCFNDECRYFAEGWSAMAVLGKTCSYRLMYDHITDTCNPIPVNNRNILRDKIIEE